VVQFYEDDRELAESVSQFLADALRARGVAIVIATEEHWLAFAAALADARIDVAGSIADGGIIKLDAAETLGRLMPHGRLDKGAFRQVVATVVREAASRGGPVHAFGEMVALLWDERDVVSVIELEELWNELGCEVCFSLLCAYNETAVARPGSAEALERVCQLHGSVLRRRLALEGSSASVEVSRSFAAEPDAPHAARQFVAEALLDCGRDAGLVADAQLVVSELASNAVRHAQSSFSLTARCDERGVRLTVEDQSDSLPTVRPHKPMSPSGHGLHVVAQLSDDWGVGVSDSGKFVWADLAAR